MQANMGMAGEFRVLVKRADGSTKIDTGYQKNLILDQGLNALGRTDKINLMTSCVIGSGNSTPIVTQTGLDSLITGVGAETIINSKSSAYTSGDRFYKVYAERKYLFNNLNNVNVSEVGLCPIYRSPSDYLLATRALIKDSKGNPTTITVLSGETLQVFYRLWVIYDTQDITGTLNLLDGAGGLEPYNFKARLASVGNSSAYVGSDSTNGEFRVIGSSLTDFYNSRSPGQSYASMSTFSGDIADIKNIPATGLLVYVDSFSSLENYVVGSYKKIVNCDFAISTSNGLVRSLLIRSSMGWWQIRFGSVADDSPITKTSTQTLSIPIEFSWGRYEGAL